jgi:hypothetical protein
MLFFFANKIAWKNFVKNYTYFEKVCYNKYIVSAYPHSRPKKQDEKVYVQHAEYRHGDHKQ